MPETNLCTTAFLGRRQSPSADGRPSYWVTACLMLGGLVAAALSGCGDGAGRVAVSGEVTVDEKPLDRGTIKFVPAAGTEGPEAAGEIKNGRYEIPAADGPGIGRYQVEIRSQEAMDYALDDPREFAAKAPPGGPRERIAAQFNDQTTLEATTTADGPNEFSFPVKWRQGAR